VIRPATLADRRQILDLVLPLAYEYPLRFDVDRANEALTQGISGAQHFVWVDADGDDVNGVIIGLTGDNLWAQRKNCNIVAWVSRAPGAGAKLLREFRDWVKSRRAIKVAGLCPDIDTDPRIWDLAERIGFKRHGGAYLLFN
jgi:hypothetical protein